MFSITRKPAQNACAPQTAAFNDWDPFRMLEHFFRVEPYRELVSQARQDAAFVPRFDIKETKEGFTFKADLPGVKEEDIEISLTGNRLSISGKREAEEHKEGENYYIAERTQGSFTRTFTLPDGADTEKLKAVSQDGVLTLTVPKRAESQPRRVTISK